MKIKHIKFIRYDGTLIDSHNKETIIYEDKNSKPIKIIYMPNTKGKTLAFNSLKHLFSHDIENYIKKTNVNLQVEILFNYGGEDYLYTGGYQNFQVKYMTGNSVKDFGEQLEKELGIYGTTIKYKNKKKNTLKSINRFNFLSFEGISDDEETNEIPFINTAYDGGSKKLLLVYYLGADISNRMFNIVSDYEFKKDFIDEYKGRFEKYEESLKQMNLSKDYIDNLFVDLKREKNLYGDISVAIKELDKLIEDYREMFGETDELKFLNNELRELRSIGSSNQIKIKTIEKHLSEIDVLQQAKYLGNVDKKLKKDDLLNYEKYKKYKNDLSSYDNIEIDEYIKNNIDNHISSFKEFLNGLYNIFIGILHERELLPGIDKSKITESNIEFNEDNLSINIPFGTSEGFRKAVRVLSFIGLHFYSSKNETRNIGISFYDTFIENTGTEYREALFDTVIEFSRDRRLEIPEMFLFISDIEKISNCSIHEIAKKHSTYIDLIQSNGINELYK